ncbi:MAG: MBL fold metallo-hydrolase [Saprospiraceae bacterium]|nr:MBL fold metallo-hydrolase [Saprospiraceae bacterium]
MASITPINSGYFKLDGGAMFGVVPKSMWSKLNPPDEANMCTWAMRCLLVQDGDRNIIIDTGIGFKQDEKFRGHFRPEHLIDFETTLSDGEVTVNDITDVLLTHLHFDHAGGALRYDASGKIVPTFPNAKVWTNDFHYRWATQPNERERASFLKENIHPFIDLGILHLIDVQEGIRFSESITLDFVYGHTGAMMIPNITLDNGSKVIFCADLLPSSYHVGMPYIMAYDVQPLITLKEKEVLYEKATEGNTYLYLEHDRLHNFIRVSKQENGRVVIQDYHDTIEN